MKSPPSTISSQDLAATLSPEMVTLYESLNARAEFYEAQSLTSERFWSPRPLPWQIIEPIVNAIEKVPEVFAITKLHQLSPGSSTGYPIRTTLLASGLVQRTHDLGDGLTAITELLTLIQTNITKGRLTLVLAGLQVEKSVEIATGIILCPFKDVRPPPWYKD